jgi:hypothetical protein
MWYYAKNIFCMIFPAEIDCNLYKKANPDLQNLSDESLVLHWKSYGLKEGRIASSINNRYEFMKLLIEKYSILEIGVFDTPSIEFLRDGIRTIHYADWLNREQLVARAKEITGRRHEQIPEINYVLSKGFDQITTKYDAIVSHHCVEHQPDLVRHFQSVISILSAGGWYLFSAPDKRRCFDYYLPESSITDVLSAYYNGQQKPSLKNVIEHRCFTRTNFESVPDPYECNDYALKQCIDSAIIEYSNSEYVDVHCWQLTPHGMKQLIDQLIGFKLLPPYRELKVYCAGFEFFVAIALE